MPLINVYYGDAATNGGDGNFNHVGNYYASLGVQCGCGNTPGVLLGRLPNAATDNLILAGNGLSSTSITTGPIGGYAGPISWLSGGLGPIGLLLADPNAIYSGAITIQGQNCGISAGHFPGAVSLLSSSPLTPYRPSKITGGIFTGSVTREQPTASINKATAITGGSYTPTATVTVSGGTVITDPQDLPNDPGFASGGGSYIPVITVTGFP